MAKQEEYKVKGEDLVDRVKQIIKEGNVRRISIKTKDEKSLIDIPLTVGVIGIVIAPVLAAVSAIAALVAECTISVTRED